MSIFIRTIPNVMGHYGCSAESAQRFIELRNEGYGTHQAALLAGIADPPEEATSFDDEENPITDRLRGRAQWLRERGRIKDAELMESALAEIEFLAMSRSVIASHAT
jgi:hypothetical protein